MIQQLDQLAICDFCQEHTATLCYSRLRLQLCLDCARLLEVATREKLTEREEPRRAA